MSTTNWYVKLDSGFFSNPKAIKAGRLGRELFLFVLCSHATRGATGAVPSADVEPWYLAHRLGMTDQEAAEALVLACDAGLLQRDTDCVRIVGWDESWRRSSATNAERQAAYRERRKADQGGANGRYVTGDVTEVTRDVTSDRYVTRDAEGITRDARGVTSASRVMSRVTDPERHVTPGALRQAAYRDRKKSKASEHTVDGDTRDVTGVVTVMQRVTQEGRKEGSEREGARDVTPSRSRDARVTQKSPGSLSRRTGPDPRPEPDRDQLATWVPADDAAEIARERDLDLDHELAQFRDDAAALGKCFRDPDAAFRKWLRQSRDTGHAADPSGPAIAIAPPRTAPIYAKHRNCDGSVTWVRHDVNGDVEPVDASEVPGGAA